MTNRDKLNIQTYIVVAILVLLSYRQVQCQPFPTTIVYYDTTPSRNVDFESAIWQPPRLIVPEHNLVAPVTGPGAFGETVPLYQYTLSSPLGEVTNRGTFQAYFLPIPGVSLRITSGVPYPSFSYDPFSGGYVVQSNSYFPLDGKGFADKNIYPTETSYYDINGNEHNFHWCMHISTGATLERDGAARRYYAPDGDLWVFINNILVLDTAKVMANAVFNVRCRNCPIDIFYCQKSTQYSRIVYTFPYDQCVDGECCRIEDCNPLKYCQGVTCDSIIGKCFGTSGGSCVGNGSLCYDFVCNNVGDNQCVPVLKCKDDICHTGAYCVADDIGCETKPKCDDEIPCTFDTCDSIAGECTHFDLCPTANRCIESYCDHSTKSCHNSDVVCPPNPNLCQNTYCSYFLGCTTENKCKDDHISCTIGNCDPSDGLCRNTTKCIPSDICHVSQCDNVGNCVETPKDCNDGDPCTLDSCDPAHGGCQHKDPCDLTNLCKDHKCVNGTCTYTDKCISQDACIIGSCPNPTVGCTWTTMSCDDNNPGTIDMCKDGVCHNTNRCDDGDICTNNIYINETCVFPSNCITEDLCSPRVCDQVNGCVTTQVNCNDGDPCTEDKCMDGICYYHNICPSTTGATTDRISSTVGESPTTIGTTTPTSTTSTTGTSSTGEISTTGGITQCIPTPSGDGDGCPYGMYCAIVRGYASCIAREVPVCTITSEMGEDDGCPLGLFCVIVDSIAKCIPRIDPFPIKRPSLCKVRHHMYSDECPPGSYCVPFNQTSSIGRCLPTPPHPYQCTISDDPNQPSGCPRGTHCIILGDSSLCIPNHTPKPTWCIPNYKGLYDGCPDDSYCTIVNGQTHCIPNNIVLANGLCRINPYREYDGCPKGMLCIFVNEIPSCVSLRTIVYYEEMIYNVDYH